MKRKNLTDLECRVLDHYAGSLPGFPSGTRPSSRWIAKIEGCSHTAVNKILAKHGRQSQQRAGRDKKVRIVLPRPTGSMAPQIMAQLNVCYRKLLACIKRAKPVLRGNARDANAIKALLKKRTVALNDAVSPYLPVGE